MKASRSLKAAHARHLEGFLAEYPEGARAGEMLYDGTSLHWFTDGVLAVPLHRFLA